MHDYTLSLLGGLLMGASCVGLVLFNGRILGVSGVLGGAFSLQAGAGWRWAFLGGMLVAGLVTTRVYPAAFSLDVGRSLGATVVGGLLIGAGTQLGSGCTSGHGICGIGRLSVRSLVATGLFMAAGMLTVVLLRRGWSGAS